MKCIFVTLTLVRGNFLITGGSGNFANDFTGEQNLEIVRILMEEHLTNVRTVQFTICIF